MSPQDAETRNFEHILALIFTLIGGIFWIVTAFMGREALAISGNSVLGAFNFQGGVFIPLVFTLVVLIVGYANERVAAIILTVGFIFTIAWGILAPWSETGVWVIMSVFFILPTLLAMVLFWLSAGKKDTAGQAAA